MDAVARGILGVVPEDASPPPDEAAAPSPVRLRHYVPREILDVSFPVSVRGYDRRAVDAYVERVNRIIAELKVSASPQAAVRHALDQAGEKVEGLLAAAREAAEQITATARAEGDEAAGRAKAEAAQLLVNTSAEADRLRAEAETVLADANRTADGAVAKANADAEGIVARATAEAEKIVGRAQAEADERLQRAQEEVTALREEAEAHRREVQADTATIADERRRLLEDIRSMANALVELVSAAASRLPPEDQTTSGDETSGDATTAMTRQAGSEDETQVLSKVTTGEDPDEPLAEPQP